MLEDLEDSVEVEVVLADIPAIDPSPDLIPAAETLTFPACVSTALSTHYVIFVVGPSAFSLDSSKPSSSKRTPSFLKASRALVFVRSTPPRSST